MNTFSLKAIADQLRDLNLRLLDIAVEADREDVDEDAILARLEQELATERAKGAEYVAEIERLKAIIASHQQPTPTSTPVPTPTPDPKPTDPPPVIITDPTPDVEIRFASAVFRPQGQGVKVEGSSELVWRKDVGDTRLIVAAIDDEIQVTTARCWHDLPLQAPTFTTDLLVAINGREMYKGSLRLGPHTCPSEIFNRKLISKLGIVNRFTLSHIVPEYMLSARATDTDLTKIATGKWPYAKWAPDGGHDPWSEDYGVLNQGWTGGLPWGNEASVLTPFDVFWLNSQTTESDHLLYNTILDIALASGNFPIHYWDRETGRPILPESPKAANLPVASGLNPSRLVGDNLAPRLKTAAGVDHPLADIAHMHPITYMAGLLTGRDYFASEQESWALLMSLTKTGEERSQGLLISGQVRAYAWALRALLHACILATGEHKRQLEARLIRNFNYFRDQFTLPATSPGYRDDHLFGTLKPRGDLPTLTYKFIKSPSTLVAGLWNNHAFTVVAQCCVEAGYKEAIPMRDHCVQVVMGWWDAITSSPKLSSYLAGWGNCAVAPSEKWIDHAHLTFEMMPAPPTSVQSPIDMLYLGFFRDAAIAAAKAGHPRGREAQEWVDAHLPAGKSIPPAWAFAPAPRG